MSLFPPRENSAAMAGSTTDARDDSLVDSRAAQIRVCLEHLAHLLPAQAPLRDFVHHNTLHALQHLPFVEALRVAAGLTGARPWLAEERCRELFRQGRVTAADLAAALRQVSSTRADEWLFAGTPFQMPRGEVLQAVLLRPPSAIAAARLRWLGEEDAAFERLQADLPVAKRQRLLAAAAADGLDEKAAVAELWVVARVLCKESPAASPAVSDSDARSAGPESVAASWQKMLDRLGNEWSVAELLAHLTGEDLRQSLQATLIRHLAAHLDQGLAAWRNPARGQGFYAAWRQSAGRDWAWGLDELTWARNDIGQLPDDPLQAIASELLNLGIDESRWGAYLQRLALELPGWAGMFNWRESDAKAHANSSDSPVGLADFLAVRVVLERLYGGQLLRRVWGLSLGELGEYFVAHPGEFRVRDAFGNRQLPEEILDAVSPLLGVVANDAGGGWPYLAARLAEWRLQAAAADDRAALSAWPLFVLAQGLGLSPRELHALGVAGAETLLRCATSLTDDERGEVWLLAYERHYREQILAALVANHGRSLARSATPEAQFVLCMDDREEGMRRHLEEVNPACETFGVAGFFGVPMFWQGIDDEQLTALCPVVVRPTNTVREEPSPASEVAQQRHRQRRRLRLLCQERLHQGGRRGCLSAALCSVVAGPPALLTLLARVLAPGRLGDLLGRCRDAFEQPLAGILKLTAEAAEASRVVSSDTPRAGFSEAEQVARVAGFLRSIGLTKNFAPLVAIIGHGSDSRNNPHLAAYDCGACSGRHGGPNARVLAAMANRRQVRAALAEQELVIPETTHFISAEHNTCDETFVWYDSEHLPASQREAFAVLQSDCQNAARLHAVERCRRFASAPPAPSPRQAQRHLADRRQDLAQARPELGHATIAAAFIGRRMMSRGAFFDRRVFLISYDPLADHDGKILEATLLAAGPVGAGINLEYYFSTVDNERFGCGSKIMHNLSGGFGVMQGASSDLRTGLPLQMVEIHEPMRLLVVVEQTVDVLEEITRRQPPLQELIGNGWIVLAAKNPRTARVDLFDPATGWRHWQAEQCGESMPAVAEVERSRDWFFGHREALPPALLRRPLAMAK